MNAIVLVVLAAWVLEALALAYLLKRRGYDAYSWGLLGLFLGPIALVLAISRLVRPAPAEVTRVGAGHPGSGGFDVLIGVDGSAEANAAVARVKALVGQPTGRVTLARVAPIDAAKDTQQALVDELTVLSNEHPELEAATVVLHGNPADVLRSFARDEGYDLLVVGSRGAGRKKALTGSVASSLARGSSVPVLVVDDASQP